MKKASSVLKARPFWRIPSDEEVTHAVPGHMAGHLSDFHGGLEKIECEAIHLNDAGTKVPCGIFQHFEIVDGGRGRLPALGPEYLAQIIYARCSEFADKRKRMVNFIVWLYGSPARGKDWKHKLSFKIDGTPAIDATEDDGYEEATHGEFDDGDLDASQPLPPAAVPHLALPYPDRDEGEIMTTPSALEAMSRSPVMQEMAMVKVVQTAFAASNAEHRALAQQVRMGLSHELRDMKSMFQGAVQAVQQMCTIAVEQSHAQVVAANERADRAERQCSERVERAELRIQEMNQVNGGFAEEIARHGYTTFIDGLKMVRESVGREQEYDRAFLGLQLQNLQSDNRKTAASGVFSKLLPFGATALSSVLRARGDEKSANTIDALSKIVAKGTETASPVPEQPVEDEGPLPKIIVDVRALYDSLRPDQTKELQRLMPKAAWQLFEGAADTGIEAACFACLSAMTAFLQSDQAVSMQVLAALDVTQQQALMAIVQEVQGLSAQPATAPAAATTTPTNGVPVSTSRKLPPRPGPRPSAT